MELIAIALFLFALFWAVKLLCMSIDAIQRRVQKALKNQEQWSDLEAVLYGIPCVLWTLFYACWMFVLGILGGLAAAVLAREAFRWFKKD